jgi:hypothetical protein
MLLVCIYIYINQAWNINNFGYISSGNCILVSKVVGLAGYFSMPRGFRDPKRLGNTILENVSLN